MRVNDSFARRIRLRHLYRSDRGGLLVVPLDHPISTGSFIHGGRLDRLVGELSDNGVDAVVLHKGALRQVSARWFRTMSLLLHLSAGTRLAPDPDDRYLVSTVEEAVRLGAGGVSVHVNAGSLSEGRQVADLARVAEACDRWGMPLLAMVYVRGPNVSDGRAPELVAHATAVAAELGADLVKTALPDLVPAISDITANCPIPVLAAGGPIAAGAGDDVVRRLADAVDAGAG